MSKRTVMAAVAALLLSTHVARAAQTVTAKVLSVDGRQLTVSAGSDRGIAVGQSFTIYTAGKTIRIPLTDTVTYQEGRPAGEAKAVRVTRSSAVLQMTSLQAGLTPTAGMDAVAKISAVQSPPRLPEPGPAPAEPTPEPEPRTTASRALTLKASATSADPGEPITVTASGHAPGVFYTWSVEGGQLSHARSAAPQVTWFAPRKGGSHTLTAVMRTSGGATKSAARVTLTATGASKPLPGKVRIERILGPRRFGESISANNQIADVAFDDHGWLYILDSKTRHAYAIDPTGSCPATFPREESGAQTLSAPVALATVGDRLYVADAGARRINVYRAGPAGGAKFLRTMGAGELLDRPVDIAADTRGSLFMLDYDRRCIHVFDPDGSYRLNMGRRGSGQGQFLSPTAIACDTLGNVVILDSERKNFQVFDKHLAFQASASVAVTGAGEPVDLAVRATDGAVLVLYGEPSPAVVAYGPGGGVISSSIQKKSLFPGLPAQPVRMAIDATGTVAIAPKSRRRVHRYDAEGRPRGVLTDVQSGCRSLAVAPSGVFFGIADSAPLLRVWNPGGWLLGGFVDPADETYGAPALSRAAVSGDGRTVFVMDPQDYRVLSFTPYGKPLKVLAGKVRGAGATPDKLHGPRDLVSGPGGSGVVLDAYGFRTVRYYPDKPPVETRFSRGIGRHELIVPWRLAVDTVTGETYIYDHKTRMIKKYRAGGGFVAATGRPGTGPGQFSKVERMVVGSRGELWVFDSARGDIQRIDFRGESAASTFTIKRDQLDAGIVDIGTDGCGGLYVLTERDSVYVFTQR